ncbi:hypothetical protein NS206_07450 [Microbacterium testaceum]|uniref:hypothetical protein n=1 Tax=Microbacterium TaxID=33882 RepID=UPI000733F7DE|nr:hypothetical protein [Microbacterium testaceum]KTS64650.1 hypothetical protein NS206_07450 [Microbacterium testaceum]
MTIPSGDPTNRLSAVLAAIDADHPLKTPLHYNVGHVAPRLDRLEAKLAYTAEYIAFLEQRIAALEARLDAGSEG